MAVKDEHKIRQHGKDYVLFAGLVAEAHEKFVGFRLTSQLDTALFKINPEQPVVYAHFEGDYVGEDGQTLNTIAATGIGTAGRLGDKGPASGAPVEMAETRAKARALRIAVNIGETAYEEIPSDAPEQEVEEARSSPIQKGQAARANPPKRKKTKHSEGPVEPETLRRLRFLADTFADARGDDEEEHWTAFIDNLGHPAEELIQGEAEKWIERYTKGLNRLEKEGSE